MCSVLWTCYYISIVFVAIVVDYLLIVVSLPLSLPLPFFLPFSLPLPLSLPLSLPLLLSLSLPLPSPSLSPSPSLLYSSFPFLLSCSLSLSLSLIFIPPPSIVSVPVSNVNYYGVGKGPIHMNFVTCRGSESRLIDCRYSFDTRFYSHAQDAGLICYNGTTGKPYLNSLYRNWFFICLLNVHNCMYILAVEIHVFLFNLVIWQPLLINDKFYVSNFLQS